MNNVTDTSIFFRLREERKRIGFTQIAAAERSGVTRETWNRYESGAISPGTDAWEALAAAGADVQYILTGQRSANAPLPADESLLLDGYRASSPETRKAALRVLLGGDLPAPAKKTKKVSAAVTQLGEGNVFNQSQGDGNDGSASRGKRKR